MAFGDANKFVAAQVASGAGNTVAVAVEKGLNLGLAIVVTAAGTTWSPVVQWSPDGTNFGPADPADTFTAITATGTVAKVFTVKAPYFRLSWGAPTGSFTFDGWKYVTE
jgi:hypothetical protein